MRHSSNRGGNERGASLIELLVSITLLGVTLVAVLTGLGVSVIVSDAHRKLATAGAEARTFAEKIESRVAAGTGGYVPCATTSSYAGVYTAPAGYVKAVTGVQYWAGTGWSSLCAVDLGLQRVSVQVSSSDGRAVEAIDIVVRKACAPGQTLCN